MSWYVAPRNLHSFPTLRSSDLLRTSAAPHWNKLLTKISLKLISAARIYCTTSTNSLWKGICLVRNSHFPLTYITICLANQKTELRKVRLRDDVKNYWSNERGFLVPTVRASIEQLRWFLNTIYFAIDQDIVLKSKMHL